MSAVVEERESAESAVAPVDVVAKPESSLLFMARRSELRLTITPRETKYGPNGEQRGQTKGRSISFKDNILRIPKDEGVHTFADGINAGTFEAPASEIREWLREHPLFGDVHEGFWEVDPVAPAPSKAELQALMSAAMSLDLDTLDAIIERESAGWNREEFLSIAQDARNDISGILAKAQADAEAKVAAAGAQGGQEGTGDANPPSGSSEAPAAPENAGNEA